MRKLCKILNRDVGSIGIGAMIVFIAMVLVAGIAASAQAMATGSETTVEVAGGVAVFDVGGHVATEIDGIAITVRTRAGSPGVDLNETVIMISDGSTKVLLAYDFASATHFNTSVNSSDADVFGFVYDTLTNEQFGILVLEDADSSCLRFTPVINRGDKAMLYVNTDACFGTNGINTRTDVFGFILPEHGSPGVISFRTPAAYSNTVYDLQ
jgi:flagellin FlaB